MRDSTMGSQVCKACKRWLMMLQQQALYINGRRRSVPGAHDCCAAHGHAGHMHPPRTCVRYQCNTQGLRNCPTFAICL